MLQMRLLVVLPSMLFVALQVFGGHTVKTRNASIVLEADEELPKIRLIGFYEAGSGSKDPYNIARLFLQRIEEALERRTDDDQKRLLLSSWAQREALYPNSVSSGEIQTLYDECIDLIESNQDLNSFWLERGLAAQERDENSLKLSHEVNYNLESKVWKTVVLKGYYSRGDLATLREKMVQGARYFTEEAESRIEEYLSLQTAP